MSSQWQAPPLPVELLSCLSTSLSAGYHFGEQMEVRKSWMWTVRKSSNLVTQFFVALHGRKEVNLELKKETKFFGDIVIVPYIDSYDLVVLKTVAICEYGVRTISAKYIMKFDVDTFIRVDSVMKEVNKIPSGNSLYIGNINYYHKPLRSGKWVVTYELIHGGRDARVHVVWQIPSLCSCLRRDGVDLGGDGGDAILYNTLIDGYTKEGDLEEVMKAFSQMRETKINPNVISFSSLIDAHCKRGNMEMAMGVYTEKVVRGLEPDVVAYTALVDGHAKAGNLEVAFMMHKEMVESGVVTNAFTLSCLVDGLFKNWRTRDAVSLFLERTGAKDFGKVTIFVRLIPDCPLVLPNSVSYMAMIYGLYRDGQHFKAGRFYYMMREAGLVPDIQT